ncbi:hypothetical protein, partial [Porphyromonas gingivalis]|uniref:hypothetical protein n=1 Tax=Porphyromonas gingivalis TaxID=837 RepID=UPI001C53D834
AGLLFPYEAEAFAIYRFRKIALKAARKRVGCSILAVTLGYRADVITITNPLFCILSVTYFIVRFFSSIQAYS